MINGSFRSIGSDTYTSDEIDSMLALISAALDSDENSITSLTTNLNTLSRAVEKVAQDLNDLDVEGYTYYATLTNDNGSYIYTLYEVDGNEETVKSQFTLPSGGGGGGSSSTTTLEVERITPSPIIATPTDSIIIEIDYSSVDGDGELIDGTYVLRQGSTTI